MNVKLRPQATCHPDRPHYGNGLCKACNRERYRELNHDAIKARDRARYAANPKKAHAHGFKYRHSFTDEDVARLNAATICDWCEQPFNGARPRVDHDHRCCPGVTHCRKCTRGFVHDNCNNKAIAWAEWFERKFGIASDQLCDYRRKFRT